MFQSGQRIGEWVVDGSLGRGGMGSVYRCHHSFHPDRLAAIKVLEHTGAVNAQRRFVREAEILYTLDHPHVVKVRQVRVDDEPWYLEMDFIDGVPLSTLLSRGALPVAEAVTLFTQLAQAIAHIHARGVFHRDIKPANLLQDSSGLKLVDFGLALEADRSRITQHGMTFGTVAYAPPEWARPDEIDPTKWDLYAMGVCFYELLTGQVAFGMTTGGTPREQAMQLMLAKQSHPALDPGPAFHDDVRAMVRSLTQPDPAARPIDAAAVARLAPALSRGLALPELLQTDGRVSQPEAPSTWLTELESALPAAADLSADTLDEAPVGGHRRPLWLAAGALAAALMLGVGLTTASMVWAHRAAASGEELGAEPGSSGVSDLGSHRAGSEGSGSASSVGGAPSLGSDGAADGDSSERSIALPGVDSPGAANAGSPWAGSPGAAMAGSPGAANADLPAAASAIASSGATPTTSAAASSGTPPPTTEVATASRDTPALSATRPRGEPPAPVRAAASGPVTIGAFSRWLSGPGAAWQPAAARDANKADANYLSGWSGASPPPGVPSNAAITGVSWRVANRYCAARGGLAPLDAAPTRWADSDAAPYIEWRQADGRPAWRTADGDPSTAVQIDKTQRAAGLRCSR